MSSTRQVLRRGMSDLMGDFIRDPDGSVPTCSAQGGASGITAIDALLSYYEDDYFNDWYFVLPQGPSGSGSYEVTRVVDFTSSTGTLTLEPDATAQIASDQPYELHRYSPALKHTAINRGAMQASRALFLPKRDETLIVDNLIATNSDFETAVSAGDSPGWTRVSTPTLTDETTIRMHGTNSLKFVATGLDQIYQAIDGNMDMKEIVGKDVTFRAWAFAEDANAVRIGLSFDSGSTFTYSDYHDGKDHWQDLEVKAAVPADWTTVRVYLDATDATCYFDFTRAFTQDRIWKYTVSSTITQGPYQVLMQTNQDAPEGQYLPIGKNFRPISGRILRLLGRGVLTAVTAETGTMEISDPDTELLYAYALRYMAMALRGSAGSYEAERLNADLAMWAQLAEQMEATPGMSNESMGTDFPDGTWWTENDGETRYLVFAR